MLFVGAKNYLAPVRSQTWSGAFYASVVLGVPAYGGLSGRASDAML